MLREIVESNRVGNISWKGKTAPEDKYDILDYIEAYDENVSFSGMTGGAWQRSTENNQSYAMSLRALGVKSFKKNGTTIELV